MLKAGIRKVTLPLSLICLIFSTAMPVHALVRAFDIYMDQPLVQGSYISPDADAVTETFNTYPTTGLGSCTNSSFSVGTLTGICSVFDSPDFGASDTSSAQFIGGSGSQMISGHNGVNYKITFSSAKKYVGFWWSAGSTGNTVNFYSRGAVVASLNVNQVFSMFGNSPYYAAQAGDVCYGQLGDIAGAPGDKCFGNSMESSTASSVVNSLDGTKYLKNLYFGNPDGFDPPSGGPETMRPSSRLFSEPFVYIHAFAKNGADFDAVEFSGSGFEIDNLTIASNEKTPRSQLVFVSSVPGNYVATFDSQGGSAVAPGTFTSGGSLNAPSNPTRSGYSFGGWVESTTSSTALVFPYSPGVDADIYLYAKWFRYSEITPNNGQASGTWITLTGENLSHTYINGFGYETVYYRSVANLTGSSPGSWVPLSSGDVRDGAGTSIDVKVPSAAGVNFYQFHIDVCRNWTSVSGCVSLDNPAVYSISAFYSVTYDGNLKNSGAVPIDSSSPYSAGNTVTVLSNSGSLARSGFTFIGWNSLSSGSGTNYLADGTDTFTIGTSDVTLFAKWNADTHTVSFDSQGGSSVSPITFVTDGSVSLPSNPSRSGYTFNGWFVAASGGTALTSPYSPGGIVDVTLYAQWTQNPLPSSGGGSSSSAPAVSTPEATSPGVSWLPSDLVEGDSISENQLNATFSVPGTAVYSLPPGFTPEAGTLNITVTFTPTDKTTYMVLSTTRTIQVSAKPKPTTSPISTKGSTPSPTPTPTQKPIPVVVPEPETMKISELKKLGTIYFNNNEYFLDAKDRVSLSMISAAIKQNGYRTVIIQGNTDIKKGVDNFWLSKARAEAVSKYLARLSAAPFYNRVWYASKRPVAVGLDKSSLALNRRVEIYAQVVVQKPVINVVKTPTAAVGQTFSPISFNRNESFLDAGDRATLVSTVKNIAASGCTKVFLQGSHDLTKSSVNAYIGTNRVKAVKKFMAGLLPSLKFSVEPEIVSPDRVVKIRCTS